MNGNPGETPNPLNPAPAAPQPVAPAEPAPVAPPQPTPAPVAPPQPMPTPAAPEPTPVALSPEPVANQETTIPATEPKKKSHKKAVIISIIAVFLIALGCGVAAIAILKPFNPDAVPAAISKLMGGAPDYVMMSGTVTAAPGSNVSAVSELNMSFSAGMDNKNHRNYANATVNAGLVDGNELDLKISEVRADDTGLYLKLDGIATILEQLGAVDMDTTNCIDDTNAMTNCGQPDIAPYSIMSSLGLLKVIDSEWILIPSSTFSGVSDLGIFDTETQCLVDAAGKLDEYGKDFADMYNANQFVTYSTDNIAIVKKKDPVYRLSFDAEKLTNFINAMNNSGFANELRACTGDTASSAPITTNDVSEILAAMPTIYVEIDEDHNFTRVYLTISEDDVVITADISFSYPSSITIEEPEYYISFNDLLAQILSQFYGTEIEEKSL